MRTSPVESKKEKLSKEALVSARLDTYVGMSGILEGFTSTHKRDNLYFR